MGHQWAQETQKRESNAESKVLTSRNPWFPAPASLQPSLLAQLRPPSEARNQGPHTAAGMGQNGGGGEERHPQNHPNSTCDIGERLLLPTPSTARPTEHAGWCAAHCHLHNWSQCGEPCRVHGARSRAAHPCTSAHAHPPALPPLAGASEMLRRPQNSRMGANSAGPGRREPPKAKNTIILIVIVFY